LALPVEFTLIGQGTHVPFLITVFLSLLQAQLPPVNVGNHSYPLVHPQPNPLGDPVPKLAVGHLKQTKPIKILFEVSQGGLQEPPFDGYQEKPFLQAHFVEL
jgi:hypothetical protein